MRLRIRQFICFIITTAVLGSVISAVFADTTPGLVIDNVVTYYQGEALAGGVCQASQAQLIAVFGGFVPRNQTLAFLYKMVIL